MLQDSIVAKLFRKVGMNYASILPIAQLDYIFPFIVFFYGFVVILVLELPHIKSLAKERMPRQLFRFEAHRKVALISLYFGAFWSLQTLWFS
jgi:hypothetical protein